MPQYDHKQLFRLISADVGLLLRVCKWRQKRNHADHHSKNWADHVSSMCAASLAITDGMRRPVSERDAVRSQVIDALEAQEIKETGNEEE